ncbi:MAG TPA: hypothetical protein VNE61_05785 [Ktedonobacteraceae bacterium]|nr:hypothetical protein [Ktedonobacteraceae bacterium]
MSYTGNDDYFTQYPLPQRPFPQNIQAPADMRYSTPAPAPSQQIRPPTPPAPRPRQSPPAEKRMPKAEALSLVQKLKRWIVVASVMAFGVIGALAVGHVTGITSQATNSATQQTAPASSSQNGGFFQQPQGGNQFGSGSSSQAPVTTSRTS